MDSIRRRLRDYLDASLSGLPPPERIIAWVFAALVIKFLLLLIFNVDVIPGAVKSRVFYEWGGDSGSYISPIENWISSGIYAPDFRLPGYGGIYLALRVVFNRDGALNSLVVVQILLSSVSVYCLAALAQRVFSGSRAIFHAVFFSYGASTFVSIYDRKILTESLVTSAVIFGAILIVWNGDCNRRPWRELLAGLFFCWGSFMRPAMLPIIVSGAFYLLLREYSVGGFSKRSVGVPAAFLLPFVLAASCWGFRNWRAHRTPAAILPQAISPGVDPLWRAFIEFHQAWGGNFVYWDPAADIHWFGFVAEGWHSAISPSLKEPPSWVSTPRFERTELLAIREATKLACDLSVPAAIRIKNRDFAAKQLTSFAESLKSDRPFVYYVVAPISATIKLLATSGTYNLYRRPFSLLSASERLLKIFMSCLYVAVVVLGSLGICFLATNSSAKTFVATIPIIVIAVHGIIYRFTENRYIVPAYPFLLIYANALAIWIFDRVKMSLVGRVPSVFGA